MLPITRDRLLGFALAITCGLILYSQEAAATIVRLESGLGIINVRLYDTATPISTTNFLKYVNDGDFVDNFIHRSIPGFISQGGGFNAPSTGVTSVVTDPPIQNEFGISNLRGTIAYAKLSGSVNSATSGWFFNVADNSTNLDNQNGGFTVFGRVVGTGMTVVDAINALPRVNAGGAFTDLPVVNYTTGSIQIENLVRFTRIHELPIPEGDFTSNNLVDHLDLAVWQNGFGSTTLADADANGNAMVDGADFLTWQRDVGASGSTSAQAAVSSVPEPSTFLLAAAALSGLAIRRCRTDEPCCIIELP